MEYDHTHNSFQTIILAVKLATKVSTIAHRTHMGENVARRDSPMDIPNYVYYYVYYV